MRKVIVEFETNESADVTGTQLRELGKMLVRGEYKPTGQITIYGGGGKETITIPTEETTPTP